MSQSIQVRVPAWAAAVVLLVALVPLSVGQSSPAPAGADAAARTTGTVEPWSFTFNTTATVPANGSVLIALPDGFALTSGTSCTFQAPENVSAVTSQVGPHSVACRLDGDTRIENGTDVVLQLDGVRNPTTSGPTGTFQVELRDENGTTTGSHEAPSHEITPHAFSGGPVQSNGDHRAGHVDTHTFDFTLFNTWEADGRLHLVFPSGYAADAGGQNTSQATFTGGADGTLERVSPSGTTLVFQRTGGSTVSGGASVTVEVIQIRNPTSEGWTEPFTVRTLAAGGGVHDEGQAGGVYISTTATQNPPPSPSPSPSPSPTPSPEPSPSPTNQTASPTEPAGVAQEANETSPTPSDKAGQGPRSWNLGGEPGGSSPAPTVAVALVVLGLAGAGVAVARRKRRR